VSRPVRFSPDAADDLDRLAAFLVDKSPAAALRAVGAITHGAESLETFPERGRPLEGGLRELVIPFGRYAYVVEYRVDADAVVISRVRQSH